jgi:signal transduction histidine kinase
MSKINFEYKIVIGYLILGSLWILFSDELLHSFIREPVNLTRFQTYKGWFFVTITAILLYMVVKAHLLRIRKAEEQARESERLKTAFLHNISHEIRTPMNGIIGFSGLLRDENLPEDKKEEYIKIINICSYQLLNIVNGILDISLLETGSMETNEKKVNLNDLLDEIYSLFRPIINVKVMFTLEKGLPDDKSFIMTDDSKIRKVLSNLINNAVKYTDTGLISFGYTLKEDNLEFFVEDTGSGIPEDFQNEIFKNFQKAETGIMKLNEGLGLGLSISKGTVDLLNGKIWFDSKPGKGTTFYFTVPFRPIWQHLSEND